MVSSEGPLIRQHQFTFHQPGGSESPEGDGFEDEDRADGFQESKPRGTEMQEQNDACTRHGAQASDKQVAHNGVVIDAERFDKLGACFNNT